MVRWLKNIALPWRPFNIIFQDKLYGDVENLKLTAAFVTNNQVSVCRHMKEDIILANY